MVKEKKKLNNAGINKFLKPYNEDMERYLEKLVEDSDKKLAKYFDFDLPKFKPRVAHLEARSPSRN